MKSSASPARVLPSPSLLRHPRLALSLLAAASLSAPAHAQTSTSAVPGFITYQGKVSNPNGTLVGAGTPVNRTVIFRIWSHQSNGTVTDLVYSEQQNVTIADGEFSVLIGQGSAVTATPLGYDESAKGPPTTTVASAAVFGGATRYLGMTIDDPATAADPEVSPRQQLVTSAYAFRAKYAESVGSNGVNTITALDSGNVGIGTTNPGTKLEVAGNIRAGGAGITNPSLQLLANHASTIAASIGYANSAGTLSSDAAAIDTVFRTENGGKLLLQSGVGASALVIDPNNRVGIGTSTPNAALDVNGALMLKSALTNSSGRPTVGPSRVAAEISGYGSGGALNDDGFLRLSAGGGTSASIKSFIDLTGYSTVAEMDKTLVFGTAGTERMRISNSGAMLVKSALTNASARPAVAASRLPAEIAGYGSGGLTNDDGFLRLSAGGGTTATAKSYIDISGFSTVSDMNSSLVFGTAGTERMRVNVNGNVGIGTTTPNAPLNVLAATNTYAFTAGDGTQEFGLFLSSASSAVQIGSKSNHNLQFFTNNAGAAMVLTTSGRVGINNNNPTKGVLHVSNWVGQGTLSNYTYFNSAPSSGKATAAPAFGIWSDAVVGTGQEFIIYSDERMKIVEGRSDGAMDLRTLLQIEVTDYRYKDKVAKGDMPQKKVLGQQLERVFPQAVKQVTDTVPDIFHVATLKDGWIILATDLKKGERIKLITDDGEKLCEVCEVAPGRFQVNETLKGDRVFVYGREVKDFRAVDYDAIAMLNVSATQELARENDALKKRVAELETKDRARDTKLAAIEMLLSSGQTVMAWPSAPTTGNASGQE